MSPYALGLCPLIDMMKSLAESPVHTFTRGELDMSSPLFRSLGEIAPAFRFSVKNHSVFTISHTLVT
jgi:hypothetical protein